MKPFVYWVGFVGLLLGPLATSIVGAVSGLPGLNMPGEVIVDIVLTVLLGVFLVRLWRSAWKTPAMPTWLRVLLALWPVGTLGVLDLYGLVPDAVWVPLMIVFALGNIVLNVLGDRLARGMSV